MLRNLNRTRDTYRICGSPYVGVIGSTVPSTGLDGGRPALLYDDVTLNGLASNRVRLWITAHTFGDGFFVNEDSSWTFDPPGSGAIPDGTYTATGVLIVDDADQGTDGVVLTLTVGATVPSYSLTPANSDCITETQSVVMAYTAPPVSGGGGGVALEVIRLASLISINSDSLTGSLGVKSYVGKAYLGDVGTPIELETGASLVGATGLAIVVMRPDSTSVTWTATATGTSVRYVTQANDLNQAGQWTMQARVTNGAGIWFGDSTTITVYEPFN